MFIRHGYQVPPLITVRVSKRAKVMFSQAFVCSMVGGGVCLLEQWGLPPASGGGGGGLLPTDY